MVDPLRCLTIAIVMLVGAAQAWTQVAPLRVHFKKVLHRPFEPTWVYLSRI